jgi:MarR-like DNA-binding transcriptional regulator SgrR of sgrS sRNA
VTAYLQGQVVYRHVGAIARWAQCSPGTVRKVLRQLEAQGRLKTAPRPAPDPGDQRRSGLTGYLLVEPEGKT